MSVSKKSPKSAAKSVEAVVVSTPRDERRLAIAEFMKTKSMVPTVRAWLKRQTRIFASVHDEFLKNLANGTNITKLSADEYGDLLEALKARVARDISKAAKASDNRIVERADGVVAIGKLLANVPGAAFHAQDWIVKHMSNSGLKVAQLTKGPIPANMSLEQVKDLLASLTLYRDTKHAVVEPRKQINVKISKASKDPVADLEKVKAKVLKTASGKSVPVKPAAKGIPPQQSAVQTKHINGSKGSWNTDQKREDIEAYTKLRNTRIAEMQELIKRNPLMHAAAQNHLKIKGPHVMKDGKATPIYTVANLLEKNVEPPYTLIMVEHMIKTLQEAYREGTLRDQTLSHLAKLMKEFPHVQRFVAEWLAGGLGKQLAPGAQVESLLNGLADKAFKQESIEILRGSVISILIRQGVINQQGKKIKTDAEIKVIADTYNELFDKKGKQEQDINHLSRISDLMKAYPFIDTWVDLWLTTDAGKYSAPSSTIDLLRKGVGHRSIAKEMKPSTPEWLHKRVVSELIAGGFLTEQGEAAMADDMNKYVSNYLQKHMGINLHGAIVYAGDSIAKAMAQFKEKANGVLGTKVVDTSSVSATAMMHLPKDVPQNLHPVVTDPARFTADVREITKAHPTLLYAAAVMRPSLALAQGHALSLLQGMDVTVHEFNVSPEIEGFQQGMTDLIRKLKQAADLSGLVSSCEEGLDRSKNRRAPATLRFFARRGQEAAIVVMFSGSVIMLHEMKGFAGGVELIEEFARTYSPREKGFIHHLSILDGKIQAVRYENNDDGYFPDEAYPFIVDANGGANAYIARYLSSKSAILNLYGLAGTGKSTLMRKAATLAEGRTCLLVDNPLFYQDPAAASALIQYIRQTAADGGKPLLMLEEADDFIRQKDNFFLPQLLSLTSGVLTVDVKIMIATNLKKIDDLMAAMQRSGRTFGNIEFFRLSPEQAVACHAAFKLETDVPAFDNPVPLSDILSEGVTNIGTNKNSMGFTAPVAAAAA